MNVSEFYENIVLRDILEYAAPGAVVVGGLGLIQEALCARLGLGPSFSSLAREFPWLAALLLFLGYVTGHILSAVHSLAFRGGERTLAVEVLTKEAWLKSRVVRVVADKLGVTVQAAEAALANPKDAEVIREIARSIIHCNAPDLHSEFVGRHSILSRFCQNMATALAILFACVSIAAFVQWDELSARVRGKVPEVVVATGFVAALGVVSVAALLRRAPRLRRFMARHTFEIWLAESMRLVGRGAAADAASGGKSEPHEQE